MPVTDDDWAAIVRLRRRPITRFLSWAAQQEAVASLRLRKRADISRVRRIGSAFGKPWWAAVVYSCFDSQVGALAVAEDFHDPVSPELARRVLSHKQLPRGSVQHHRTQPAHKGAKVALIAACARADDFERILLSNGSFHHRYQALRALHAEQWGRTTCFDLLVRTGQLGIGDHGRYEPDRAYLADSTGPQKGFNLVWGIDVTKSNAEQCEALLRGWTERWHQIASQVGVDWVGEPYHSGDFENALCVFQERGNPGHEKVR